MTRADRVIAFAEAYCRVPEGAHVGKPLNLEPFQKDFIRAIYDNPAGTSRAFLSIARKNGKSALIACLLLAHLVGPEARRNSQIVSGARSRDQAALVYKLAEKMVRQSPELMKIVRPIPSQKTLIGLPMNVEFKALAADAGTAHGLSPVLAILDEVGQVRGPTDAFIEAIETAQGAHESPLLVAISTQAADDNDMFSIWLDDAAKSADPRIVSRLYAAPDDCEIMDREAWLAANPALGVFRSEQDMLDFAEQAKRLPGKEQTFRWLYLNQRVEADAPFISRSVWQSCAGPAEIPADVPVYGGLDLSSTSDLTAVCFIAQINEVWHVKPTFWLPGDGLPSKAKADRVPYDIWHNEGYLQAAPGRSVDYEFVAFWLRDAFDRMDVRKIAFDRWGMKHLTPWLQKAGFSEHEIETHFVEFGQGFASMSPALRVVEAELLNGRVRHGGHPVLQMCAANARVVMDPSGNRKLTKAKATGRIDGMIALSMAFGVAPLDEAVETSFWDAA
jgi:phage terminase large subunit-like protein